MNKAILDYTNEIFADLKANKADFEKQINYIKNSTAKYHGRVVRTLAIPKVFDSDTVDDFRRISETTHTILTKVIHQYLIDEDFRKYFGFEPKLSELIITDAKYDCLLPVARVDIFYNEETGDFKFCEINTDGSSAMNEDRELNNALKVTNVYNRLKDKHGFTSFEFFDSFVKDFEDIYSSYKNKKEKPNVAIVDFLDHGTVNEFEQFRLAFEKAGYNCEVIDIQDLLYRDGQLISPSGMKIDAIYRRAVTCDIMDNIDKVNAFISAVKDNAVCLVGSFRTQVAHSKILFKVLSQSDLLTFLTNEERAFVNKHFPKTYELKSDSALFDLNEVYKNKNSWIIKPVDSYASYGVHAGVECKTDEEWFNYVNEGIDNGYILQEFVTPYITKNTDFENEYSCSNLTGLFLYNGKFRGIYSRVSKTEIISTQYSEMTLASVICKEKDRD